MKTDRRRFLLAAAAVLAAWNVAAAEDSPRLRVLTYNIHHGEGTDGRLDLERIAKVVEVQVIDEPVASDHCPVLAVLEWTPSKRREP